MKRFLALIVCGGLLVGAMILPSSAQQAAEFMLAQQQAGVASSGNALDFVADIAEETAKSVVSLEISVRNKRKIGILSRLTDDDGEGLFSIKPKILSFESRIGDGSGFIISADGYIVTNAHVVTPKINGREVPPSKVEVILFDGRRYPAEIVGTDEDSDIAVIKIDAQNLQPIRWGNSSAVRPGEFALTIGSSLGAEQTVGFGIISAVSRKKPEVSREALFGDLEYIQTYAQINPGNSGGPLINLKGEVIGITSFIQLAPHSPGFAIPADYAKNIAIALIQDGYVKRPSIAPVNKKSSQFARILDALQGDDDTKALADEEAGVVVVEVKSASPAQRAGLKEGDLILRINGKPVVSPIDFIHEIRSNPVDTVYQLQVYQDDKLKTLKVRSVYF